MAKTPPVRTPEQHRARHVKLHRALDELMADFIFHTGMTPKETSLMEFSKWAYEQTQSPTEK